MALSWCLFLQLPHPIPLHLNLTAARGQNALHTPHCLDPIQKGRAAFCSDICTMQPVATWLTES